MIKERPIPFSVEMVRQILNGQKTQTRRVVKPQLIKGKLGDIVIKPAKGDAGSEWAMDANEFASDCPYGKPGDRLWVKETYLNYGDSHMPVYFYRADDDRKPVDRKWKGGRFMPRMASRLTLEITGVRVERLHDISYKDCFAEGIIVEEQGVTNDDMEKHFPAEVPESNEEGLDQSYDAYAKAHVEKLWDARNGKKHPWASNPWVWVVEFKRLEPEMRCVKCETVFADDDKIMFMDNGWQHIPRCPDEMRRIKKEFDEEMKGLMA
jgi:hypothetical protein